MLIELYFYESIERMLPQCYNSNDNLVLASDIMHGYSSTQHAGRHSYNLL